MNLKYNRLDMKEKQRTVLRLKKPCRKQPLLSKLKQTSKKHRQARKDQKREFGTDLTNISPQQPPECQTTLPELESTPSETSAYTHSIMDHLQLIDTHYQLKLNTRLLAQSQNPQGEIKPETPQGEISPNMRRTLVKWLLQVGRKFQVSLETLHLCVQLVDYMLVFQKNLIDKFNFQLLGVASLFVASKYNEIHTFEADKYVYVCDGLYSMTQLFQMESLILISTNFSLQMPSIFPFTAPACQKYGADVSRLIAQLGKLVLYDFKLFNCVKKQQLGAVVVYFALKIHDPMLVKSKVVMEEQRVPEDIFRQCFGQLLNLYRSKQILL